MQPDKIIRSSRKSIALVVTDTGEFIVRAPKNASGRQIAAFIAQKQDWLNKKLSQARRANSRWPLFEPEAGATLRVLGGELTIELADCRKAALRDRTLVLPRENAREALIVWLKKTARTVFSDRVEQYSRGIGAEVSALCISSAKTRWGSCSGSNSVQLNYRLLVCEPAALDYVVVHELCHTLQKNHGAAFWQLVATHFPEYQKARRWLKDNSAIMNYI